MSAQSPNVCETCHEPLVQRGSETVCVRCLAGFLAGADDGAPDDGESSATEARRYGHFELLTDAAGHPVELGRGSMGATYRARDTVLHREVALKVIEQSVAALPAARQRFLREARAAARFQHPAVAAVSHYGEQDGECYYVMELVEGETLEARVRRAGPLSAALTLEIASQISQALVAAEALGIVHRDLKPSNLMLLGRGEDGKRGDGVSTVKVIDFGLAKAVDAAAQAAGPGDTRGGFVGTPAFASPEQFRGAEDARIDGRADIYSLGATLWYALCGRSPFAGRTLEEIHARQNEPLPTAQLLSRHAPKCVVALLESTLAFDVGKRPQSARELLERLERCQAETRQKSSPGRSRLRWVMATGLVILAAAIGIWWSRRQPPVDAASRTLAVLPFENASPDHDDAFFTTGMQDEITADLARLAALKVISPDSAKQYPPGPRDYPRIGAELGVHYLLAGRVRRDRERVQVEVRLVDTAQPTKPWVTTYDRRLTDSYLLQGEIARTVADRLQTPLSNEERAAIGRPPTMDQTAYDLYLRARDNYRMTAGEAQARAVFGHCLDLLDQATQRDPNFFLAYCSIAQLEDELGTLHLGTPEERAVDHRARAESALAAARRIQPDSGRMHLAMANHLVMSVRDFAQAKIEIDLAQRSLPNSSLVESITARIAENTGQWDEALAARERAIVLNPRNEDNAAMLEQTCRMLRRYPEAEHALEQLLALTPREEALPMQIERGMEAIESRADLAPLRAALAPTASGEEPAEVNLFRFLLAYFDRDPKGLAWVLTASSPEMYHLFNFVYPKAWFEGLAARLRGDPAAENAAFTTARAQMESWLNGHPTRAAPGLSVLAMIDAGLGRKDDAVREARLACDKISESSGATAVGCLHSNLAVVYAWTGQPDLALAELDAWTRKPAGSGLIYQVTYGDLKLDPVWDPLRSDPRFTALVERLAPPK